MKFTVTTLAKAERDHNVILDYISSRSRAGAVAWAKAYDKALVRLEEAADTLALAPENEFVEVEVRQVLFKTPRGIMYRALFTIRGHEVIILHIRGAGQDLMPVDELV